MAMTFKKFLVNGAAETVTFEAEISGSISRTAGETTKGVKYGAWSIENAQTTLAGKDVPLREIIGQDAIQGFIWVRKIQQALKAQEVDTAKAMLKEGFTWGQRSSRAAVQKSLGQMLDALDPTLADEFTPEQLAKMQAIIERQGKKEKS